MIMKSNESIALIDLDGTLCDYHGAMDYGFKKIKNPKESEYNYFNKDTPSFIRARRKLISNQPGWWLNLKPLKNQFKVLEVLKKLGFELHILTKGPFSNTSAWQEKVQWCKKYVKYAKITITMDKGLVYGKILMDDFPPYIKRWLEWRPRGLVIMPDHSWNEDFKHPQVIMYNGKNLSQVKKRIQEIK